MSEQTPGMPQNPPVDPAQPAAPAAPVTPPPASAPAAAAPTAAPPAPVMPPPPPTAYAAAPGAPGGPGYGTPGAPPPAGGYNKSGKNRTIALIVGGVVAVGVLGGVVGMIAGGGDDDVKTSASAPQGTGVLHPAPVGNTDPAPTDPGSGETPEPAPTEEPTPTEAPAPQPDPVPASGEAVALAGGSVVVPVPTGWEVFGSDDTSVSMGSDKDYIYAVVGTVDPSADAGQVLINSLETVLPGESYPDLSTTDVVPQQPGGSVVSLALLEYEATWTDGQGTLPVHGAVFSAVRQDGTALIILGEHTPPKEFADAWPTLQAAIDPVMLGFAGLG